MKQSQNLYEYLCQMLTTQLFNGTFQYSRRFLSQREICRQQFIQIIDTYEKNLTGFSFFI